MNVKEKVYTAAAGLTIACMAAATAHAQNLYPSSDIAMAPQAGLNQADLFTVDEDGQLNVFWAGTGGWQGPERIGPSIFVGGGNIKASQQFGLNQTDVFMVDQNGQLEVFWAAGGGAWQGPEKIGAPEFSPGSYANLTVSRQTGVNQTDVFMVNNSGQLESFGSKAGVPGRDRRGSALAGLLTLTSPPSRCPSKPASTRPTYSWLITPVSWRFFGPMARVRGGDRKDRPSRDFRAHELYRSVPAIRPQPDRCFRN